jgi:hypothetical protein
MFGISSGRTFNGSVNRNLMEKYRNLDANSGVEAFEIGHHSITIKFKDGGVYLYTFRSAGRLNVEKMQELAKAGKGLNSYISQNIRAAYAEKVR